MPFCIIDYMSYTKKEIAFILKTVLQKAESNPDKFAFRERRTNEYVVTYSYSGQEVLIEADYNGRSKIQVHVGNYYGKIYSSVFSFYWWKSFILFNRAFNTLTRYTEDLDKGRRMGAVYKSFPELVDKEFEEQVLLKD